MTDRICATIAGVLVFVALVVLLTACVPPGCGVDRSGRVVCVPAGDTARTMQP